MISRLFFPLLILLYTTAAANTLQQGQNFYQQGDFAQAINVWQQDMAKLQPGSTEHLNIIISLSNAYQKAGNNYTTAYDLLQKALIYSENNLARQVLVYGYLGDLMLVMTRQHG